MLSDVEKGKNLMLTRLIPVATMDVILTISVRRFANLALLIPDFEILTFFNILGFFLQSERLGSSKTFIVSELHIHHKLHLVRAYSMTICRVERVLQ